MAKPSFTLDFERPLRALEDQLAQLLSSSSESDLDFADEIAAIRTKIEATKRDVYSNLNAWQRVQLARHPQRPYSLDYIRKLFTNWQELHGDRIYGDDQALIGGTAMLGKQPVMIIAQQKGRDTRENLMRNFGMPHPEGYRKALRLARLAEKFSLPVISFIDTKAAYAGVGSEERHVSEAIAVNLREFSSLRTPIAVFILGEGGSGGALGIGVGDRVMVQEYAYYSVIPPEGCAAILWRDRAFAADAAQALKLGARELVEQGVADEVIPEPLGGAHRDPDLAAENLGKAISKTLKALQKLSTDKLLEQRYDKFRQMGRFEEEAVRKVVGAE